MRTYLQFLLRNPAFALVLIISAFPFFGGEITLGQELAQPSAPRIELLTMNGGKPNLSAAGEGITSYKIGDLYQRGTTRATLVKAADSRFKIELPIGYSIFNDLIYSIETDAVATE